MAGLALAALLWVCSLALNGLEEPPRRLHDGSVADRALDAWRELAALVKSRAGRIGLILAILPIGTGAAQGLYGAIAPEWHLDAEQTAQILGLGGGIAIVAGCFTGGRLADRLPKPAAYAVSCALGVVGVVLIGMSPRTGLGFTASALFYTFSLGMAASTLTAMVLAIIGDAAAATKINVFFALNTLFSLGMLRVNGWAHDRWQTNGMLFTEAAVGTAALATFVVVASRVRGTDATTIAK